LSLDGEWDLDESVAADAIPSAYRHRVPVPGLAHSAVPGFAHVDEFESREFIQNLVGRGLRPKSALVQNAGVSRQQRNWFWYHRSFTLDALPSVARLRINKAQFGATVWLNRKKIEEHLPCFTAAVFDVSGDVRVGANNLVVRIGAHPGVLPANISAGTDFEKLRWTPGIYDSVSLVLSGNPAIETVQADPRVGDSSIVVESRIRNYAASPVSFRLTQGVHPWRESQIAGSTSSATMTLQPGEEKTVLQTVPIRGARLWWPEDPRLYVVETDTGADHASTRFGMRELRFDSVTKHAVLNGRPYFMRGSNITLHRFFEDPIPVRCRGTTSGCGGFSWRFRSRCTGTASDSVSDRFPTSGWRWPMRPGF